jgi:hypothetical protein
MAGGREVGGGADLLESRTAGGGSEARGGWDGGRGLGGGCCCSWDGGIWAGVDAGAVAGVRKRETELRTGRSEGKGSGRVALRFASVLRSACASRLV